ncbi:MAG: hypothetical protein JKY65_31395, partial [Planctomycetes bacterium]|nr:hypothetical protein [Planctomycetota bacterium]
PASVASPTPSPRDDALQAVLAWQEQSEAGSLLRPLVEARYLGANDNFRHLLFAAERDPGLGSVLRAARALLGGTGVVRDVEAALTFLRYGAGRGDRTCFVLLTDTLASEGQFEEELVWLGRFAIVQAHPLELHRIWRIARSEGPKASFAQRIWAGVEKDKLRGMVMDFVEGFKGKALDAPRAKGAERTEFLIALALEAWKHEPSLRHSFQLEVVLDSLAPADQLRLIQVGSPSRLLVELCLRRGDMALLNEALPPTLAGADETWLSGITQVLFERGMAPACADQIVARFALLDSQRAQRWVAVCQLTGWGTRKNPRAGSEALRRLAAAGDHQASVRLYEATARNPPNLTLGEELLREGVAADHPQSLLHFARLLARGDSSRKDEVRALARRASRARFPPAHLYLSRLVLASASGPKDLKTVRRLVGLASDQDYIAALERGASLEVAKPKGGSSGKATSCLRRAAWLGSGRAARRYAGAAVREEEAKAKPEYRSARRYLKRAIVMGKGDVLAVLALAKLDLKRRSLRAAAIRTLHDLARADPEGLGAVALGNLLYAEGDTLAGENLLARAALSRTEGLDNYLKILKGSGREREAAAFLQAGVRARRPVFLIKVARERFATDPAWAQRALLEAGKRRPQAHVILGRLLWDTGERENRLRAWKLWLSAEARRNKVALRNLSRLPWPK